MSDTHAPRRWRTLPLAVAAHLHKADAILHAGDLRTADVLDELSQYAPTNDAPRASYLVQATQTVRSISAWPSSRSSVSSTSR
ncbi:MAG: metallophosphoesterase family protein [Actinocrinis sp.]